MKHLNPSAKKILTYSVVILIIALFSFGYFVEKNHEKKETEKEAEQVKKEMVSTDTLYQSKKEKGDEGGTNEKTEINKEDNTTGTEDKIAKVEPEKKKLTKDSFNYQGDYYKQFGKTNVKKVQKRAEQILTMYINNHKDIDKYRTYMMPSLVNAMEEEPIAEDGAERIVKIKANRLIPSQSQSTNVIQLELEVSWDLMYNGVKTSGRNALVYMTFILDDGKWYAKELKMI